MREFVEFKKYWKYPHMKPADTAIIDRFVAKFPSAYEKVAFSFPVGDGAPADPIVNEETEGSVEYLYHKKIDMVALKGNAIHIIEVKPKAGASAIGQVCGYRDLYMRDEKPAVKPKCVILTDEINHDLEYMAKMQGVEVIVV